MRAATIMAVAALAACAERREEPFVEVAAAPVAMQQRGEASYYHPRRFTGRRMANGDRFDPRSNSAAHPWLPFGTVLEVTNLDNGETREVVIEDRGPHVRGRILDVSPRIARELGMIRSGVAPVEIREVGQVPDGARDGRSGN
jgi:rare lipoprotein A